MKGSKPYQYMEHYPSLKTIAEAFDIPIKEIEDNRTNKDNLIGFPIKFLEEKAVNLARDGKWDTFMDVLALIIYGIVLFPTIKDFVDFMAIDVFLAYKHRGENPVPAVLADIYCTLDFRHEKEGGLIHCCSPILYFWFVKHIFQDMHQLKTKSKKEWANVLANLNERTIQWYSRSQDINEGKSTEAKPVMLNIHHESRPLESNQSQEKWQALEERLRVVEGGNNYGFDASDLCLVSDVIIPPKFKLPEFDKYKGTTCPKNHLIMYCRKMGFCAHDEKLLIHFFQDSLTGASLSWYMHLERAHISSWKDLVDAFLKHYKYNLDMAPDRIQLQNMTKRGNETFKEYAQRWRELASQVEPPLSEKEMVTMFINTLQPPFYDKMIGSVSSNFSDLVIIGERVEMGLKSGKIASGYTGLNNTKKLPVDANKKKEEESHFVVSNPANPSFVRRPYPAATSQISGTLNQHLQGNQDSYESQGKNYRGRKFVHFDPIPMTYAELLPHLNNPLPVHGGPIVNAIEENHQVIREVEKIKAPMGLIFSELCKFGLIQGNADVKARCNFHLNEDHSIEECNEFKKELQKLINMGTIQIGRWEKDDGMIATQSEEKLGITIPKPLVIHFTKEESMNVPGDLRTLIVQIPSPFSYKDNKAVPWNYNVEVHLAKQKDKDVSSSKTTAVTNVSGIGGMTRNDRICSPGKSQREMRVVFEKAYTDKEEKKVENEKVENEVSNEEAQEFLKIIKQSEYKIVDQLNHTPTRISLLSLLMNYESHRKLLMKILNEAHVTHDITVDKFGGIINNITANNHLTFTDDELPTEGRGHNKALHISVMCLDHIMSRVLIDNGSSLNVISKSTLAKTYQ
ncbi:uncharacterized protein [Cicer arietinum]|uniref:uncharacterized protein n=1 Tax=Cicer arietinum TaxID=3827 RepID=UPI003CC5C4A9